MSCLRMIEPLSRRRFLGYAIAGTPLIVVGCGSERKQTLQSSPVAAPVVVSLHGAGGDAEGGMVLLQ